MKRLKNKFVTVYLDERWPRIVRYESPDGTQRLLGEREALPPRLYLYRQSDRLTLTSDDPEIEARYVLEMTGNRAVYHAKVEWEGQPAAAFDVTIVLRGADCVLSLENISECDPYCFVTARFAHLVSATSLDPESLLVTCGWQGRLLDPKKCKPQLIDYSWVGFIARLCGAAYRPGFMVTLDLPGYEDLLLQEVWQYSRIGAPETLAGLGAELMYRQRTVENPEPQIKIHPPAAKTPPVVPPQKPVLCADRKEVRLHFVAAKRGKRLDWTNAAKYFQSLVPAKCHCEPRYENALVYKIVLAARLRPLMTFALALDIIRRIHDLTGGMKQVCYLAYFQHEGGETGYPDMFTIYPPVGDKAGLRRVIQEGGKYNAVVSFHQNLDVFDTLSPSLDPDFVTRDSLGRMSSAGYWHPSQLVWISMPAYRKHFSKLIRRLIREYGIHDTYHLDSFSGAPYMFDAHPTRPFNASEYQREKFAILEEFNRHGIDVTSENLTDPYVGRIGHVWALFNGGTVWEGEEAIPLANFIYHGAISWNSGRATDEKSILESLIQGGGSGIQFPDYSKDPIERVDSLYLIQPVYALLRNRRWTGYRSKDSVRRVDYGRGSYIAVDDAKPGYRVVVDGTLIARDFTTVFPGPERGTYLACSRTDRDLNWLAPAGWKDGKVAAVELTESGPGIRVPAEVRKGRLLLTLKAHQPVHLTPPAKPV